MSRRLTQPEEIDQVLREMAEDDMKVSTTLSNKKFSTSTTQEDWSGVYVSPYRAEYIKSHGFADQGNPFRR